MFGIYYADNPYKTEGHTSISVLDAGKKAVDYPKYLVKDVNSTFSVYVQVENQMGIDIEAEVLVKVTHDLISSVPLETVKPILSFRDTVLDDTAVENVVIVNLEEIGNYAVIFELWIDEKGRGEFTFSGNFCVLNVQVA